MRCLNLSGEKLLLIDGNSLIYRAFYALPLLTTTKGEYTNAIFGFTKMFMQLLEKENPDFVAVAMDKSAPTFREKYYESYKANRQKMPDELGVQLPTIREIIAGYGVPVVELAGYEGDDIIGTMSRLAEESGLQVKIVTSDRDVLQLVSELTTVLLTKKGISELEEYTLQTVRDKYGFEPVKIIDLKGLMGDQSDNIPGVPGVGEKTALKLLQQFDSIEDILANIEQVNGKKLKERLIEHSDLALISKKLAAIERNVPSQINLGQCKFGNVNKEKLINLFQRLEFRSLMDKLRVAETKSLSADEIQSISLDFLNVNNVETLEQLVVEMMKQEEGTAIAAQFDFNNQLIGLAFAWDSNKTAFLDFTCLPIKASLKLLKPWLETERFKKYAYNFKLISIYLLKQDIKAAGLVFDPSLAAYLIDSSRPDYSLETLASEYLSINLVELCPSTLKKQPELFVSLQPENLVLTATTIYRLFDPMNKRLKQDELKALHDRVEIPLINVLAFMEHNGIMVEQNKLKELSTEISRQILKIEKEVYDLVEEEFNLNSPKQLGVVLFEKLGLPAIKKTKTGYSTSADVLEGLIELHPVVEKVLEYRQLTKLKSTYLDGIAPLIDPESGRIHTTFNQTVTTTGRLSSTEPNLQNIPIRLEVGRKIRKMFVPAQGYKFLAADYSQIELRVLAHIANDKNLIETFQNGGDIHTRTAAEIFGVSVEDVTREMRDKAKTINFGIIYGMSDFRLSRDIGVSPKEAGKYISNYFARYQGVSKYIETIIEQANKFGYVTTLLNRRRYLPDINNKNRNVRQFAQRTAVNTPIQGSAADIIKIAMVNVYNLLREKKLKTKMLLQVHDELVFEVPSDELSQVSKLVKTEMEQAVKLSVPLVVDVKLGDDWYSMKNIKVD